MQLERIITLANTPVELPFRVMERSLRATGCDLPLAVIPYDNRRFDLPDGAYWLEDAELFDWLDAHNAWPACRKYACFQESNYLYVDTDVVFLKNPSTVFESLQGFITSCRHWSNSAHTTTPESEPTLRSQSTTWQKSCFNSGQWGCDRALFSESAALIQFIESRREIGTLLTETQKWKDQPAINLIVNLQDVPIHNLTLPPHNMESTWAGDYTEQGDSEQHWANEASKPFLIHWAGIPFHAAYAINELPKTYLLPEELEAFYAKPIRNTSLGQRLKRQLRSRIRSS